MRLNVCLLFMFQSSPLIVKKNLSSKLQAKGFQTLFGRNKRQYVLKSSKRNGGINLGSSTQNNNVIITEDLDSMWVGMEQNGSSVSLGYLPLVN